MARLRQRADGDYSRPRPGPPDLRPHDLVYIAPEAVAPDAPDWVKAAIARGEPAVVRRGRRTANTLPLGVRGDRRSRRYALCVDPRAVVAAPVMPEALAERAPGARAASIPALAALPALRDALRAWAGVWGIGGAVGFELASGVFVCHSASDVDLLLRVPIRPVDADLATLADRLAVLDVRCDVQLETPAGGVALADWLSKASEVLIKTDIGPCLAADPWRASGASPAERVS